MDWPNEATTGVTPGTSLSNVGGFSSSGAGQVIEGLNIQGTLYIDDPGVIVRNCQAEYIFITADGVTIEDSTIVGENAGDSGITVLFADNTTIQRCDISGTENGIWLEANGCLIQDNYIHGLRNDGAADPHYDGLQIPGGSGVSNNLINHNNFDLDNRIANACITMADGTNIDITNNRLNGGSYVIYFEGNSTACDVINNVFTAHTFGYWSGRSANLQNYSGNVFSDSGSNPDDGSTYGTSAGDVLQGNADANTIYARAGNDTINGNDGSDTIYGEAGNDIIAGGNGNDGVQGGEGDDFVAGGAGNDALMGQNGNDMLWGDDNLGASGDDGIDGGNGNDTLLGLGGSDTLVGGAGYDTIAGGDGNDRVLGGEADDLVAGGAGDDAIMGQAGNDVILGDDNSTAAGNDAIDGGDGNDTIVGQGGNDTLVGGTGNDAMAGGDGVDILNGHAGADIIFGGNGADLITGGAGADILRGEAGGDLFVFNFGDNGDLIQGFNQGGVRDGFDLRGYFNATGYIGTNPIADGIMNVVQSGADTDVYLNGSFAFRIEGVTAAAIDNSYFISQ
jgi:Ca2+-binding RTX toxin-like protein